MLPIPSLSLLLFVCVILVTAIPDCFSLNLPPSSELESLSMEYPIQIKYAEQRIFPSLRFTFSGRIIGWTIPAIDGTGGGRPFLSVWRPSTPTSNAYSIHESSPIDECLSSTVTNNSEGLNVFFHESGPPAPGISFNDGDILGLLVRNERASKFIPFLYDGALQTRVNPVPGTFFSYFFLTSGEKDVILTVGGITLKGDGLLPLLSLKLCSLNSNVLGLPICNGTTAQRSDEECSITEEETTTTMSITTTMSTTATATTMSTTMSTTTSDVASNLGLSEMLLTIFIAAPSALFIILAVTMAILITMCCLFARKRKHSTYTVDIAMEDLPNGNTDTHNYSTSGPPPVLTYDTSTTTTTTFTSPPNGLAGMAGVHGVCDDGDCGEEEKNNGAGNYEAPVTIGTPGISGGGSNVFPNIYPQDESDSHVYDSPSISRHTSAGTPRSTTPLPPLPVQQINLTMPINSVPPQQKTNLTTPLTPPLLQQLPQRKNNLISRQNKNMTLPVYETLDQTLGSTSSSDTYFPSTRISISVTEDHSSVFTPSESPRQPKTKRHSSENLMFRRISSGRGPLNNNNICKDTPTDRFFRLEDGVYVPTKRQRNCYSISSLFDDTSYATFKAPNSPNRNNWDFFEECETYWRPASDSSSLFDQLANKKYREINRKQIEIGDHLGSGEFGTVCCALWHTEQGDLDVAVKILNKQSSEKDTVRFIQEAAIMGQFKHPNIVRLHGVVTVDEPMVIILELVENGDLRKNLKLLRPSPGELIRPDLPQKLLEFCSQIALGMEYLSRRDFIHRDLAARNILLTEENICKIADFGMTRDLDDENHYISETGKIPIKWAAPETMRYRKFSIASDVWSFGILMYEVWSLGRTPYKNMTSEQTITLVGSGCRLAPPPGCPRAIYDIMIQCWNPEPNCRPSFTSLLRALSQPTSTLLHWSPNDSNVHPQASVLGSELSVAMDLYPVMQKTYMYATADSD